MNLLMTHTFRRNSGPVTVFFGFRFRLLKIKTGSEIRKMQLSHTVQVLGRNAEVEA